MYFSVESSEVNKYRFEIKPDLWDPENSQSYCGNDVRCLLCTLLGECEFARPKIRMIKSCGKLLCGRRDFVLMKERTDEGDSGVVVFRKRPRVVQSEPEIKREPILIGEIFDYFGEKEKIFLHRDVDAFLKGLVNINDDKRSGIDYVPVRPPSIEEVKNLNSYTVVDDSGGDTHVPLSDPYDCANPFIE